MSETPYIRMLACLKESLTLLSGDSRKEADELCDRIIGLVEPPKCHADGCKAKADNLAYRRFRWDEDGPDYEGVFLVCRMHAEAYADERAPEYLQACENCGCWNPIN